MSDKIAQETATLVLIVYVLFKRTANIGIPDTYYSIPGFIRAKGKTICGFVASDADGFSFHAYRYGKNSQVLP